MHKDNEITALIVAGDPAGLAEAYARYAGHLYSYCRTLLRCRADAADAVQDTFVIASSRLAGLRDPGRLRAWLFAVARNECLRRLKTAPALSAWDAADVPDEAVDVAGDAERAEVRALVHAAIRGLSPADRDVIILQLSQLDAGEIGDMLGVSRNHAGALMSRARRQLLGCVAVLLVSRAGRRDCQALEAILRGWDGHLTALVRKRVLRHIEKCRTCSACRRRELRPAMLLGMGGGAVLAGAASMAREAAAGTRVHIAGAADRAGPWMRTGFPRPLASPHRWLLVHPHGAQAAAGAAAATAIVAAGLMVPGGPMGVHPHPGRVPGGPVPSASASPSGPASPPRPARTGVRVAPVAFVAASPAAASPASPPVTSPSASQPGPVVLPTALPTVVPSSLPTVVPTVLPTVLPTVTVPPVAGTITVSPGTIVLTPLGGTLTVTAHGGPVSWSVSMPSSLLGAVSVSPSSGTLAAGQSVTVAISTTLVSLNSALTVEPGGEQVTIILGL